MEEIDAEAAEHRRDVSDVSIDTDTFFEGSCDVTEERRRSSEVACEMVRKANFRKPALVRLPCPDLAPPPPPPPPPPPQSQPVGDEVGFAAVRRGYIGRRRCG